MTKENYKKTKLFSIVTIFILFSSGFISSIHMVNAQTQPEINFTWSEDTYSTEASTTFDHKNYDREK